MIKLDLKKPEDVAMTQIYQDDSFEILTSTTDMVIKYKQLDLRILMELQVPQLGWEAFANLTLVENITIDVLYKLLRVAEHRGIARAEHAIVRLTQ